MKSAFIRLFGNPHTSRQIKEAKMADIPALRPSVIKLIADNSKLRAEKKALEESYAAIVIEMESLKAMIEAEYDAGGSTGGVVG